MTRRFRLLALSAALIFGSVSASPAVAQDTPAEDGEKGWGPVPGYLGVGLLSALGIFILCKSARR